MIEEIEHLIKDTEEQRNILADDEDEESTVTYLNGYIHGVLGALSIIKEYFGGKS